MDDNDEVRRAHKCTEPTTPASTHAAPRRDANAGARDGMRAQRRGARRRRRGTREGGGGDAEPREWPDTAKPGVRRSPGTHLHQPTTATSTSARSASRGHPGEDAGTRNPQPPSKDPADTADDEKRRPDGPTDPPDQRMGTRRRGGKSRVKSEGSRSSRADGSGTGDSSVEVRRPGKPDEQPDEVERSSTCRNVSIEGERGLGSVLAQGRSTTRADEDDQRTSMSDDNIPRAPPEPPPPFPTPDKPAQPPNEPPSVELEGERRTQTNLKLGLTSAKADMSGPSTGDEDPRNRPKKPQNVSEHAQEHWKRRT